MSTNLCHPDQHKHNGLCCDNCPKGKYLSAHCTNNSKTECKTCPHDFYNAETNYLLKCQPCRQCHLVNQSVLKPCQEHSDQQCGCKEGFYCSDRALGHCDHCLAVTVCPPGKGVSVQHTSYKDTICSPCATGTFSDVEDYKTPCRNHTNCEELGRHLLTPGTATTDAECGDFIQNCPYIISTGLLLGIIMTVAICLLVGLLYWRTKRKSQQIVRTSECSESFVSPVLPPDIIKHPRSPEQPFFHRDEIFPNTKDCCLDCDGITLTTLTASEKYAYSASQCECGGFNTSVHPSILQSEPQEDEWPGA
ncbi:tumor necrosis factor receptor superfamily member 5 [Pygocentrus nattereri]|uniref:TNFR-Cys domain-containing protein n=1 Tax=Pygocentrus nattereri TaxID=42514 RepID=A0A3B4C145_PYGNA|nr:tumor necrosis factor receptor superfamily member 5 [Pygocentrus nattereri]